MGNVFSGARAIFEASINGGDAKKIAYAFGVEVDEEIQHEEVQTLDALAVEEHVPVAYRVTLSAEVFRTIKGIGAANGEVVAPGVDGVSGLPGEYGSLKGIGVFPQIGLGDIIALKTLPMNAKLFDSLSDTQIGLISGVRASSKNFSIRARQIVGENVRFVAKRARDESENIQGGI